MTYHFSSSIAWLVVCKFHSIGIMTGNQMEK